MNVLLLFKPNPKISSIQQNVTPNGLLYIAAYLKSKGIDTEILNLTDKNFDQCKGIIKSKNPDLVGIACYTFNRHTSVKLANIVKQINKNIKVILGGPHSSIMYSSLLQTYKDIDIIVLNEGELTFFELIIALRNNKPLNELKGVAYREDNKIISNGPQKPIENLDQLPLPSIYFKYKRIITSRGCPGRCIFCDTPHLWGQKVRFRSANNVADELEMLNKKYALSSFIISDDTFTFDKNRTIGICKEIIKRNLKITWDCRSRVNLICEERLRWMKKAGCVSISFGIESGSQAILNNLKKGITVEQIKKAAAITRKLGLNLNYFIIVGSPGETDDTIRETMKLIEETKPTSILTFIMQLTPGTEIYTNAKTGNFIYDTDWINKGSETIFYTKEKTIEELKRYARLVDELFRLFKRKFSYSEEEINNIIKEEKGVQDMINLAHIKLIQKKPDESEKIIDEAIELNPGSSEALASKAVILTLKDDESCINFFKSAIKSDPENLLAYKNFGLFFYKQKRFDESIELFKKGIQIEPACIEFYNNLGSIYGTKGEYEKAMSLFKTALSIEPNNKDALNNISVTLRMKGDLNNSQEHP